MPSRAGNGLSSSSNGRCLPFSSPHAAVCSASRRSFALSGSASISHDTASLSLNPPRCCKPPRTIAWLRSVKCLAPSGAVRTLSSAIPIRLSTRLDETGCRGCPKRSGLCVHRRRQHQLQQPIRPVHGVGVADDAIPGRGWRDDVAAGAAHVDAWSDLAGRVPDARRVQEDQVPAAALRLVHPRLGHPVPVGVLERPGTVVIVQVERIPAGRLACRNADQLGVPVRGTSSRSRADRWRRPSAPCRRPSWRCTAACSRCTGKRAAGVRRRWRLGAGCQARSMPHRRRNGMHPFPRQVAGDWQRRQERAP